MFLLSEKELNSISGVGDISVGEFLKFKDEFGDYAVNYVLSVLKSMKGVNQYFSKYRQ